MINPLANHLIDDFEKYLLQTDSTQSSIKSYITDLNELEDFLNKKSITIEYATKEDIEAYLEALDFLGKSNATINRKLSSFRSFYGYLLSKQIIESSPISGIKTRKLAEKELVYMSEDEINKLLELPDNSNSGIRDRAILETLYASGLKVSELCNLNIENLDLKIGYVDVQNGSKSRIVPLAAPCKEAIKNYIKTSRNSFLKNGVDSQALFLSYLGERFTRQGIWKIIKTYGDKTDFKDKVSAQNIRNSFAVHLIQNGADLKSLQELLGHEDILATKVYLSVSKNRILDVYNKAFPRK